MSEGLQIRHAASASGVSAKLIRYYEQVGLIPAARRTASGYRVYRDDDVQTLRFIRRARELGFPIEQIRGLLALWRDRARASADVKTLAAEHIAGLRRKIDGLQQMVDTLQHLSDHCHGDDRPHCPIIEELGGQPCHGESS